MQKYADYIKQIEIDSLWSGTKHILWNLDRRVNILSGVNGVGKSTILNKVVKGLSAGGEFPSHLLKGVHLKVGVGHKQEFGGHGGEEGPGLL